jgi:hypothetical protein
MTIEAGFEGSGNILHGDSEAEVHQKYGQKPQS